MKVLNAQIIDNAQNQQEQISEDEFVEFVQPSEISVLVEFEYKGEVYELDFQTTTTSDYGAYDSNLASYDQNPDHEKLSELFNEDEEKLEELLSQIKAESDAQSIRDEYIKENFNVDEDSFGGMDANSEINRAVRK